MNHLHFHLYTYKISSAIMHCKDGCFAHFRSIIIALFYMRQDAASGRVKSFVFFHLEDLDFKTKDLALLSRGTIPHVNKSYMHFCWSFECIILKILYVNFRFLLILGEVHSHKLSLDKCNLTR